MNSKKKKVAELKETISSFFRFDDIGFTLWFIIPGLLGVLIGSSRMEHAEESKNWPRAGGKIISCELRRSTSSDHTSYIPEIIYEYTVSYKTYRSSNRSFGYTGFPKKSEALSVLNKYRPGQGIAVYYKPGNPEIAVIETGRDGLSTPYIVGFAFTVLGSGLLLIAVFNRFKRLLIRLSAKKEDRKKD